MDNFEDFSNQLDLEQDFDLHERVNNVLQTIQNMLSVENDFEEIENFEEQFENDFEEIDNFEEQENKSIVKKDVFVAVDSEFNKERIVSLQVTVKFMKKGKTHFFPFIIFHNFYKEFVETNISLSKRFFHGYFVSFYYDSFSPEKDVLTHYLGSFLEDQNFYKL